MVVEPVRYRLDLAYDGTAYSGFASQPGRSTIQGELEKAVAVIAGSPARVAAAGRTDVGVHALGQVVAFDLPAEADPGPDRLVASIGGLMPEDIRPLRAVRVSARFDPRRDALAREYLYMMGQAPAPILSHAVWSTYPGLEAGAMAEAATSIVGVHDFSSFCLADTPEPHVRDLMRLDVHRRRLLGTDVIVVLALANAFLHGMVRALVGTLVEVGRGRREPAWAGDVLAARDRSSAGPQAPAHGLFLASVHYVEDDLTRALAGETSAQLIGDAAPV